MTDQVSASKPESLQQWLAWQETLHPKAVDLGLERVRRVAERLALTTTDYPVISVAGTNGKGSCAAYLESIYTHQGYRVGCYASPHVFRYNERVRIGGKQVADEALCRAFGAVDQARGDDSLSYFEFGTLAALKIFADTGLDLAVLEVGLGGRLDAVNIIDADLAIITSIGLDHTEWLGADREAIGFEKAGIARPGNPVVCGERDVPNSVVREVLRLGGRAYMINEQYGYQLKGTDWDWFGPHSRSAGLPYPAMSGEMQLANAATALMALNVLASSLPVDRQAMDAGLREARLPGRVQRVPGAVETILDMSHNPHAVAALAAILSSEPAPGRTHAVFSALADKDVEGMVCTLADLVHHWYLAELDSPRALPETTLMERVSAVLPRHDVGRFESVAAAYATAAKRAKAGDRIVVFGSVLSVAEVGAAFGFDQ